MPVDGTPQNRALTLEISSFLCATADEVWAHSASMAGVNAELSPISMSYPPNVAQLTPEKVPLGKVLFNSWVTLFGVIVLDRHALCLTEICVGQGFHEESTSWVQRRWAHDRRIVPTPEGCILTDRLEFVPRITPLRPLVLSIVRSTFQRRHAYLRRRFQGRPT